MVRVFLLLLFLRLFACAFPQSHVAYEPHLSSASCSVRNAVHGERLIRLIFSLSIPHGVEDSAVTILQELSDPESTKFAQHWTTRQINRLFASDPQQVREVTRWLQESSVAIKKWSLDVDHLLLDITSRNAQKLLHTTLHECVCGSRPYICSDTYHLPRHISGHIDHVTAQLHPSDTETHSPSSQRRKGIATAENINRAARLAAKKPSRKVDCFKYTTPDCLRLLYGIPSPSASEKAHPNNSIGIYAPDWSTWLGRDLDLFFGDFQPNLVSRRPVLLPINGGYRDETLENSNFFIEPNLDFGYSMSLVEPLHVTDIQ
ncbi:hypothetical protein E4U54_008031, partial [Claviceps lovelessii]